MGKQRRDADRRVRQCERFARLIRITRLLLGHGRWGPEDLAREIDCSVRTVFRDITTLTMAGIPIHFDKSRQAYRVQEGFRFPGLGEQGGTKRPVGDLAGVADEVRRVIREGEQLLARLRQVCGTLDQFQADEKLR